MPKRVLILGGRSAIRKTLTIALNACYEVHIAASAADAFALLRTRRINVIVVDCSVFDCALPQIRRFWPSLPVVAIAGDGSESVRGDLFRLGADGLISKPYDLSAAVKTIKELLVLGRRRSRPSALTSSLPPISWREKIPRHSEIQRACLWIHAHYAEPISIEDAAKKASLAPLHFNRLFRSEVGIDYVEYVIRYRIDRATVRLRDEQRSPREVARDVGFEDYADFYDTFRRVTGQGPRTWRRLLS